jgi:adenylate cyclase class IV
MNEVIVEVGILLEDDYVYYNRLLESKGLFNIYNAKTHDIYFTNKNIDDLTERELKDSCIRLRNSFEVGKDNDIFVVQNAYDLGLPEKVNEDELKEFEQKLEGMGYKKIIDTKKIDHHFHKDGMNSRIQLQDIEDIGLVLYYDNCNYYHLPVLEQRDRLIEELNDYGLNIKPGTQGIDKLRTLYHKENMYSDNQNG